MFFICSGQHSTLKPVDGTEIVDNCFTQAGEAELVYYTTVTSTTGAQYRVYSKPVTVTAAEGADVVRWNIALGG